MKRLVPILVLLVTAASARAETMSLVLPRVAYQYGLYFTPEPRVDPATVCRELASRHVKVETVPLLEGPAYPDRLVEFYGSRMPDAGLDRLAKATKVTVVTVDVAGTKARAAYTAGARLTGCLARATGALVWDAEGMQLFTAEQFARSRELPLPHVIIADEDGRPRTFGMLKLGLPDLVLVGAPDAEAPRTGPFLMGVARHLLEKPRTAAPGRLVVAGAELRVSPRGRDLLEIDVAGPPSETLRLFDTVAGKPEGGVVDVDPLDPAWLAAVQLARKRLPELRKAFNAGWPREKHLALKARIKVTPVDTENMWIRPTRWDDRELRGLLLNDPRTPGLVRRGDEVRVPDADLLDYFIEHADGTTEGNLTKASRRR